MATTDQQIVINEARHEAIEQFKVKPELADKAADVLLSLDNLNGITSEIARKEIIDFANKVNTASVAGFEAGAQRERDRCAAVVMAFARSPRLMAHAIATGLSVDDAKAAAFEAGLHISDDEPEQLDLANVGD